MRLFKMSFHGLLLGAVLLSSTVMAAPLAGEQSNYKGSWWFSLGAGTGQVSHVVHNNFIADLLFGNWQSVTAASFNYMVTDDQLLSMRVSSVEVGSSGESSSSWHKDNWNAGAINEVAVMYGLIAKKSYGYVSVSTGLSVLGIREQKETINNNVVLQGSRKFTVGIPVEAEAFFTPGKHLGFGLIATGNINNVNSFGGLMFAIQFGNLLR